MAYSKKDIVGFIQDSLMEYGGLNPKIIKELKAVVKNQVDAGDADPYIQSLNNDTHAVKGLLEDVLEGKATVDSTVNVENHNTVNQGVSEGSFRDALNKSIHMGTSKVVFDRDSMKDAFGQVSSTLGSQLSGILGEEKSTVIDPMIGVGIGVGKMFTSFKTVGDEQLLESTDQGKTMDNMYKGQTKQGKIVDTHLDVTKHIDKTLSGMLNQQKEEMKMQKEANLLAQRNIDKKPKDGWIVGFIKSLIKGFVYGMAAGAMVGSILLPFELLHKGVMKVAGIFGVFATTADDAADSIGGFRKLVKGLPGIKQLGGLVNFFINIERNLGAWVRAFKAVTSIEGAVTLLKDLPKLLVNFADVSTRVGETLDSVGIIGKQLERFPKIKAVIEKVRAFRTGLVSGINRFMNSFSFLGKINNFISPHIKNLGKYIVKFRAWLTPFGTFIKGFAYGISKLAIPLSILLGVVDFFTGFFGSNADTMIGKIKDGFVYMFMSFIELPVKLFGWLYDKAMNFIGIETKDSGNKMMASIKGVINAILNPIVWVADNLVSISMKMHEVIKKTLSNIVTGITSIIRGIFNFIIAPFVFIYKVMKHTAGMVVRVIRGYMKIIVGFFSTIFSLVGSAVKGIWALITGDIDGVKVAIGEIGDVFKKGVTTMLDGIRDIVMAPFRFITKTFESLMEEIDRMVGGIGDIIKAPFIFMSDQFHAISDGIEDLVKDTFIDPIHEFFETIGEFIEDIIKSVGDYVKKLPVIGGMIMSSREKEVKQRGEALKKVGIIKEKRSEIQRSISELEKKGDLGWWENRKLKSLKSDDKDLAKDEEKLLKKLGVDEKKPIVSLPEPTLPKTSRMNMLGFAGDTLHAAKHSTEDKRLINPSVGIPADAMYVADKAKASVAERQMEQQKQTQLAIKQANKDAREKPPQPIIVNTGEKEQTTIEPPEDIETMSILFLNKSWGLG